MTVKELLNYKLIDTDNLTISVYSLIVALIIILAAVIVTKVFRKIIKRLIRRGRLDRGAGWSVFLILKYFLWVIIVVIVLDTLGVKISILLASLTALLVGLGLGIQQLFNDLVSGIILLLERNLNIGDVMELADGTIGKISDIGVRTSKLKTRDDILVVIPNSMFVNGKVINWSHIEQNTRFHVNVGVAYGSDVRLVEKLLMQCAEKTEGISLKPSPFVRFNDFGNSSLDFQIYFWTHDSFYVENVKSNLRFLIDNAFRENGVQIPFPQRDVHIKSK